MTGTCNTIQRFKFNTKLNLIYKETPPYQSNVWSKQETSIVFALVHILLLRRTPRQNSFYLQDFQTEMHVWRQHRQSGAAARCHALQVCVVYGHIIALLKFCIY